MPMQHRLGEGSVMRAPGLKGQHTPLTVAEPERDLEFFFRHWTRQTVEPFHHGDPGTEEVLS